MLIKNFNLHVVLIQRIVPLLLDTLWILLVLLRRVEAYLDSIDKFVLVITGLGHGLKRLSPSKSLVHSIDLNVHVVHALE